MNKNLKKVISAAAALTVSASSFAAFAVNFPDVDSTASYAQAVQELSALDIISGYDDGTFKPEGLVTRAEITKMIVDARGEGKTASASAGSTKFVDSVDHWAKGYIAMGVTDGFISGYSDTEFGPDNNVTYVQAQKMLVAALGYDVYAQANGGWPGGYKLYANSLGVTEGVSANDDDQLTRAQVAQMIDNAMDTPLCVIEKYENNILGGSNPVYSTKDGEGKDYQTLFTEKHKAYKVFGRVTATSKTGNVDTDKVTFTVEKADNFDKEYIKSTNTYPSRTEDMYFGDTNAEALLRTYSEALIQKDDNDEFTIISITPAAANKSVTLAAEDFDKSKSDNDKNALYFYPAGTTRTSTKYQLADDYTVYVNGKGADLDYAALITYIDENDTAAVTLQKETKIGSTSTDSDYNVIMINSYVTAVVDEVIERSNDISVNFKDYGAGVNSKMEIQKDNDDYTYSFKLNGEEIEVTDLQEYDVLNIACDAENFKDSSFYDVIVTRDTVEEVKCTGKNETATPKEYTIGGEKYKAAAGMEDNINLEMSSSYTLYLDHFGRLAYVEEGVADKKYGVLKNIYKKAGGDYYAQVITKDGEEVEYKVDDKYINKTDAEDNDKNFYTSYLNEWTVANNGAVYDNTSANTTTSKLDLYPNQVVEYSVSSSNKLTIKKALGGTTADSEYKASSDKIGSVKLSDATVILDISDVNAKDTIKVMSKDGLVDGNNYTVVGYDKSNDGIHRLVLLTSGVANYNPETQLAIYNSSELVNDGDDDRTAYNIVVEGEEKQYIIDEDYDVPELNEGDPIVFKTNAAGEISGIMELFNASNALNGTDYATLRDDIVAGGTLLPEDIEDIEKALSDSHDDVTFAFGPVVNRNGSSVTIGEIAEDGTVNYDTGLDITIPDTIYTYDFSAGGRNTSKVLLEEGIAATPKVKAATTTVNGNDILDLNHEDVNGDIVFALVRLLNKDEAQEMYLIVNND